MDALPAELYAARRKRVLKAMKRDSVALIAAAPPVHRNRDVEYPYRQNSDFLYLTGLEEPHAIGVLVRKKKAARFLLFLRPFDPAQALWTGPTAGLEGALSQYGAIEAFPIEQFDSALPALLKDAERVYYPFAESGSLPAAVDTALRTLARESRGGTRPPRVLADLAPLIHALRLIKSEEEIARMRRAADVSVAGHRWAMTVTRPGRLESDIEADLVHRFAAEGLRDLAYPSIVAGGPRACILHYTRNDQPLKAGDLLLIDAGAECQGYASDITRTFPVSGRFSAPQRALYEVVLAAQEAAIDCVRPGTPWNVPHDTAVEVLTRGLIRLGLLKGKIDTLIREGDYRRFYMHRTGHFLGMDVHDVGDYRTPKGWQRLEAGMVLTVEPGLYVAPGQTDIDPAFEGIGIRIEDDVLVTPEGHEVLTRDLPKTVEAIEALMAERS